MMRLMRGNFSSFAVETKQSRASTNQLIR